MVANIDIAPTILELAGIEPPEHMDGKSFAPLLMGRQRPWRNELLYEYYWERNYPHTPTNHAILTDRYKFIRYHGIWDLDELYDMQSDPDETRNLINSPAHWERAKNLRERLFELLRQTQCSSLPLLPDRGSWFPWRLQEGAESADFPETFFQKPQP
jgi:N-acetylglucosamine-6-sulfatase